MLSRLQRPPLSWEKIDESARPVGHGTLRWWGTVLFASGAATAVHAAFSGVMCVVGRSSLVGDGTLRGGGMALFACGAATAVHAAFSGVMCVVGRYTRSTRWDTALFWWGPALFACGAATAVHAAFSGVMCVVGRYTRKFRSRVHFQPAI